ncbi:unnamed protein product [Cylicocyclus nassatus]|uniref:RNA-directed DNA polymerase n=1 Tax=Cylicocyclus nassatus TaxID=53992 RepID=A0AA36H9R5_CYLNA|nr:unnamed protein product [Cylicocyclus nassatus]
MKLKAAKCEFARDKIRFLGFVLSKDGIQPDPEKTKAIDKYPTPTNVTEVRAFMGMCSFFRRFIPSFANIATPLCQLLKKDTPFRWTPECEIAFLRLKEALTSAPILVAPRLGTPFIIETDSSGKALAGVLKQEQNGDIKIIAYASRTLNPHESRYPAIELEALGLVYAVQQFRPYIDGARCTIITDHAPLKALLHRKDLLGRLAKYQLILQEYDINIVYRPGKKNVVCDALSRYPPINAVIPAHSAEDSLISLEQAKKEQSEALWITEFKRALQEDPNQPELQDYILVDGLLYRIPAKLSQELQLVLPENTVDQKDLCCGS